MTREETAPSTCDSTGFPKTIGILGGMGPEATVELFSKIVKGTRVRKDQDHLRILIDNNPKIPDRTLAIEGKGPSPLPFLIECGKRLERMGAQLLIIPCVTAHHFHADLQKRLKIPVLHIVEETREYVLHRLKRIRRIGLLATTGTLRTGLFQKAFAESSIEILTPSPETQAGKVMGAIYGAAGIKALGPSSYSRRLVRQAAGELMSKGAEAIIAGCTEIPLVLRNGDLSVPVVDPLHVLARAAVEKAGGRWRES